MNFVATPSLKAFAEQLPKTRIGILRALWPTIQDCLTVGHSLRDIHRALHLDGVQIPYSTLCRIVAILQRDVQPKADRIPKQHAAPGRPGERSVNPSPVDPLRNLRRLSEHRPGFEYSGTLPDEELFGPR